MIQSMSYMHRTRPTQPQPDRRSKCIRAKAVESRKLTRREREVLDLICEQGCGHQAIADHFGFTVETSRRHVSNIFDKTGYSSMLELAVYTLHKRYTRTWEDLCG